MFFPYFWHVHYWKVFNLVYYQPFVDKVGKAYNISD